MMPKRYFLPALFVLIVVSFIGARFMESKTPSLNAPGKEATPPSTAIGSQASTQDDKTLIGTDLHQHALLTILIRGKEIPIPAGIGEKPIMLPVHTEDASGHIHMEFHGPVYASDIRLGKFFAEWGKTFNQNCILDACNGPTGHVSMSVNGKPNTDFENYIMHDDDEIEIHYE